MNKSNIKSNIINKIKKNLFKIDLFENKLDLYIQILLD